jgi:hypothetical protein
MVFFLCRHHIETGWLPLIPQRFIRNLDVSLLQLFGVPLAWNLANPLAKTRILESSVGQSAKRIELHLIKFSLLLKVGKIYTERGE